MFNNSTQTLKSHKNAVSNLTQQKVNTLEDKLVKLHSLLYLVLIKCNS